MDGTDPAEGVRALLEGADAPLSGAQIAKTLEQEHARHEVEQALDFWRREHAAVHDHDGNWSWQGLPGE